MIVIGLMSGTSADGIDAAAVEIAGAPPGLTWRLLAHVSQPHPAALRQAIFAAFNPQTGTVDRLCELNYALGRAFAAAALAVIDAAGLRPEQAALIGSHGQTVWHAPGGAEPATLQLGEAALIAEMVGAPVVSNFRARDIAAGGQGAPLVAYVDQLLFTHPTRARGLQNIGGIANVTYLPAAGDAGAPLAFDTGPGNMLIDELARRATGGAWTFDRDGVLARRGRVDAALLAELLQEPYLALPPPKTTGRELFGVQYAARVWDKGTARGLAPADIIATATRFTAASIVDAYRRHLPRMPDEVVLSGGGAQNPALLAALRDLLAPLPLLTSGDLGLPPEAKEALAFAVLAYETWAGRPGNLPGATGARRPVVLGAITPGRPLTSAARVERPALSQAARPAAADLPITEARNPATAEIDALTTLEMVRIIHAEDGRVAEALGAQLPVIAAAIDAIAGRMRAGGRLIYVGAGTSGRLGVLDASECPPTFNTLPGQVVGIIAGGRRALTDAVEGAEDDTAAGQADLRALGLNGQDCVVGIAASGQTPYVLAALAAARAAGALTISIACNHPSPMAEAADIAIPLIVGPEVITGSTRLKAGTAQKMALNMLSTGVMVRLGKTLGNLMVDVQTTNQKLRARAQRIVASACGITPADAAALLDACAGETKVAIVCQLAGVAPDEARRRLAAADGVVRAALWP